MIPRPLLWVFAATLGVAVLGAAILPSRRDRDRAQRQAQLDAAPRRGYTLPKGFEVEGLGKSFASDPALRPVELHVVTTMRPNGAVSGMVGVPRIGGVQAFVHLLIDPKDRPALRLAAILAEADAAGERQVRHAALAAVEGRPVEKLLAAKRIADWARTRDPKALAARERALLTQSAALRRAGVREGISFVTGGRAFAADAAITSSPSGGTVTTWDPSVHALLQDSQLVIR